MSAKGLLSALAACDDCGASRWKPDVRENGVPFLRCEGCGRSTSMPFAIERRLRALGWMPKVPIRKPAA
jgi:hypothetical protein